MRATRSTGAAVWFVLCAVTVLSLLLRLGQSGNMSPIVGVLVLAVAFFKVHLVFSHFMELKSAPLHWRRIFLLWNFSAFGALAGLYLGGI